MKKIFFLTSILLINCTDDDLPINPFDAINYIDTTIVIDTVSNTSFVKLHRDILEPSCNIMGCHDGSFEPDFRTVTSSYNTLVYYPVIKNNLDQEFEYRVVPGDTAFSVLHERLTNCCFVNQNDRMPQDNIGNSLANEDLDKIANWIIYGAKDITGSIPTEPNSLPNVKYFFVTNSDYDSIYSDNREDDLFYKSFLMPGYEIVNFVFKVNDDHTNSSNILVNKISFSESLNDFSNEISAIAFIFDQENKFWIAQVNTSIFEGGTKLYMRYTINDGDNIDNVTYPNNETSFIYKSMWSFKLQ